MYFSLLFHISLPPAQAEFSLFWFATQPSKGDLLFHSPLSRRGVLVISLLQSKQAGQKIPKRRDFCSLLSFSPSQHRQKWSELKRMFLNLSKISAWLAGAKVFFDDCANWVRLRHVHHKSKVVEYFFPVLTVVIFFESVRWQNHENSGFRGPRTEPNSPRSSRRW